MLPRHIWKNMKKILQIYKVWKQDFPQVTVEHVLIRNLDIGMDAIMRHKTKLNYIK